MPKNIRFLKPLLVVLVFASNLYPMRPFERTTCFSLDTQRRLLDWGVVERNVEFYLDVLRSDDKLRAHLEQLRAKFLSHSETPLIGIGLVSSDLSAIFASLPKVLDPLRDNVSIRQNVLDVLSTNLCMSIVPLAK